MGMGGKKSPIETTLSSTSYLQGSQPFLEEFSKIRPFEIIWSLRHSVQCPCNVLLLLIIYNITEP